MQIPKWITVKYLQSRNDLRYMAFDKNQLLVILYKALNFIKSY